MKHLSDVTARITGQSFSRKYIALGRVVKHWEEIMGPALALKAQPMAIRLQRDARRGKGQACLEIAASPADSTALHYQKELILERINRIFGAGVITSLRFVAHPANAAKPSAPKARLEGSGIVSTSLKLVPTTRFSMV